MVVALYKSTWMVWAAIGLSKFSHRRYSEIGQYSTKPDVHTQTIIKHKRLINIDKTPGIIAKIHQPSNTSFSSLTSTTNHLFNAIITFINAITLFHSFYFEKLSIFDIMWIRLFLYFRNRSCEVSDQLTVLHCQHAFVPIICKQVRISLNTDFSLYSLSDTINQTDKRRQWKG